MKFKIVIILLLILIFTRLFSDILWEVDYENGGDNLCRVEPSMVLSSDGGFILIAHIGLEYYPGEEDWFSSIIKFDNAGNLEWNSGDEFNLWPEGLYETDDGNIMEIGKQSSYPTFAYACKRNNNGDTLWVKNFEDVYFETFIGNDDLGFYIGGRDTSTLKACLKKIDLNGNIVWTHIYNAGSFFSSGLMTSDDCFVLRLFISDPEGNYNALMKVDLNGDSLWTFNPDVSSIKSTIETSENSLIVSTWEHIYKMDLEGNIIDQVDGNFYYAIDLPDEYCFLTAFFNNWSDYGIIKYDYNLNPIYHITDYQYFYFFQLLEDNGFIIYDQRSIHLIRTDENIVSANDTVIENSDYQISNHPNPFNPSTTIKFSIQNDSDIELSIYNIKGQKIKTVANYQYEKGNHSIVWNGVNDLNKMVSSGIYLYKLNVNGKTEAMKKCLLLK